MSPTTPEVSDDAVQRATGRGWDEWTALLDEWGGRELSHREIVQLVRSKGDVSRGWWQRTVAVGYERLIGRRTTGETADAGFQIGVQRTLDIDAEQAWSWLTSPEGVRAWLGEADNLHWKEREPFALEGRGEAEVRVFLPGERLRIAWNPPEWARPATIQLRVEAKGERALVAFHEENLPGPDEREERRAHFKAALEHLARTAAPDTGS
jgi:uncharacterized protein YndB with AHSA1/START domain